MMQCPLTFTLLNQSPDDRGLASNACLEKDCAWWEENFTQCSIVPLASELFSIKEELIAIKDVIAAEGV